jgi:hypothetical protein
MLRIRLLKRNLKNKSKMRKVVLLALIILFGLTIHSYGLRIQRPRHFTYPLSESDVSELNSILEEIWLVQQGRYEADAVPSVKPNANTGEFWINTPENAFEYIVDGTVYQISGGAPSGGATWGTITGTVTAQTDLSIYALDSDLASYVPTSRTVNGKALSGNITLNVTSDIDASIYALDSDLASYVTEVEGSVYATKGTLTNGKWCSSNGLIVSCTENVPATDEVGAVTLNKWCIGDGSMVQCTQDAPSGSGLSYAQVMRLIAIKE